MRARRLAELGAQGCSDSGHAQSRQSRADLLCTPGVWVPPLGLSRLRFPWPGNRHPLGRAESSLDSTGPRPTASIAGAAPGSRITHPVTNSLCNPVGLCSHPVMQCQHRLAARVLDAARMPCTRSQEVATKQLPVPTCAAPCRGAQHRIPPAQAQPPSARLCSWHGSAQRLPIPCRRTGAVASGLPASCQGTGGSAPLFPLHTSWLQPCIWEQGGGQGTGPVPQLVGVPGVVHSPFLRAWRVRCQLGTLTLARLLCLCTALTFKSGLDRREGPPGLAQLSAAGCWGGGISWTGMSPVAP